jgi:hypothetical protein
MIARYGSLSGSRPLRAHRDKELTMRGLLGWVLFFGLAYIVFFSTGTFKVPDEVKSFVESAKATISEKLH